MPKRDKNSDRPAVLLRRGVVPPVLLLGALLAGSAEAVPERLTGSGPVRGATLDGVMAFKGIPYAAPPVGPLRWRPPQPVVPWQAARDATRSDPACPQPPCRGWARCRSPRTASP